MIAIGGGTASVASSFSSLVSSSANINTFVTSVVAFLNQYNFDGLNIDWEFPQGANKNGFSNLLTALRQAFGTKYLLSPVTAAIPSFQNAGTSCQSAIGFHQCDRLRFQRIAVDNNNS